MHTSLHLGPLMPSKTCVQILPLLLPCVTLTSRIISLKFHYFICKMETLPILKKCYDLEWENVQKCTECCQPCAGHPVHAISCFLVLSRLRAHVNAQILLCGQMSMSTVGKFFVVLAHFCILWVFGKRMLLFTTSQVLFRGFYQVLPSSFQTII